MAAVLVLGGVLGGAFGSFLNVVIHRLPRNESLVSPRSHCPSCGADVRPRDNVPVLSWALLRGRCRDCGAGISPRYPLVELVTAGLFVAVILHDGPSLRLLLDLPFVACLVAIAAIDLDHRIIPNRIVAPLAVWGVAVTAAVATGSLPESLIAGGAAFLFLLLVALAYPAGMGMGDVKLAGVIGIYLGLSVIPALLLAFLAGSIVGVGMMLRHGAAARKRAVPFGPFLALGALVGLFAGPQLIALYASQFLV